MPSTLIVGNVIHTNDLGSYNYAKGFSSGSKRRNSEGGRGLWRAGLIPPAVVTMDYVQIGTSGNAVDFGDATGGVHIGTGLSNGSLALYAGGHDPSAATDTIEYVRVGTISNASEWNELSSARYGITGCSNGSRGIFAGGNPGYVDTMDYVTIETNSEAIDFDNLSEGRYAPEAISDGNRGLFGGGFEPAAVTTVDFMTIQTLSAASDWSELSQGRAFTGAVTDGKIGLWCGGVNATVYLDTCDYLAISGAGTAATDFGELTQSRGNKVAATSDGNRGVFGGGYAGPSAAANTNVIDYITIALHQDAIDFGDLTQIRRYLDSTSGE